MCTCGAHCTSRSVSQSGSVGQVPTLESTFVKDCSLSPLSGETFGKLSVLDEQMYLLEGEQYCSHTALLGSNEIKFDEHSI